jgi:hypothetical protein
MKHKDEAFKCFRDFCTLVKSQFNTQVKMLSTDNETEYVNKEFSVFYQKMKYYTRLHVQIHLHKMELLKERIIIFWKLLAHLCSQ